jgi:hypothetical protein
MDANTHVNTRERRVRYVLRSQGWLTAVQWKLGHCYSGLSPVQAPCTKGRAMQERPYGSVQEPLLPYVLEGLGIGHTATEVGGESCACSRSEAGRPRPAVEQPVGSRRAMHARPSCRLCPGRPSVELRLDRSTGVRSPPWSNWRQAKWRAYDSAPFARASQGDLLC